LGLSSHGWLISYQQRKIWPWPSLRDHRAARELLSRVGVEHVARQPIGELSGGQQQQVFPCPRGEPEIVLLDEPTSSSICSGDLHLLADLNQQGTTSPHDLNS